VDKFLRIALVVACLLPLAATAKIDVQPAVDFTLKNLAGDNVRLADLRGQVVLVNFWATWCGPCRQEMPVLERIHQRYQDMGFSVLGVNVEGESGPARALAAETGVSFPVLIDAGQKISKMYDLKAMPSTVIVDRDGNVRYVHRGYKPGDEEKYVQVLKELIRE
jgi:peroxiredoxin